MGDNMRTTEEPKPRTAPWQWPAQWFNDEKFWREVASRTVSGIIVVTLGFMVAMISGLVPDNHLRSVRIAFALLTLVLFGLHMIIMPNIVASIDKNLTGKRRTILRLIVAIGSIVALYGFTLWMWISFVPE